ncbi:MAG TPA: acyltransferase, partial [Pseudolabrys sp.]|nr:acyltransferase [Pseudolabrys sp.]
MSDKSGGMIGGIQVLRALAAVLVTICHAQAEVANIAGLPSAWPPAALANLAGFAVQLFFVISGFIMVYSTEPLFRTANGPWEFLKRRLVRIVPLYWIVTSLYLALMLLVSEFAKGYPTSFVIASYFFIPAARPDGVIEPVVGQGWSLNYEMLFYVIFAATVFASRRVSVAMVSVILLSLIVVGNVASSLPLVLSFWTSPILLHF